MRTLLTRAIALLRIAMIGASLIAISGCGTCKGRPAEIAPVEPDPDEPATEQPEVANETPAPEAAE